MATLTFSYDTGSVTISEIVSNCAKSWGYLEQIPDPQNPGSTIPNPQTASQFCKNYVKQIIIGGYKSGKTITAYEVANATIPNLNLGG